MGINYGLVTSLGSAKNGAGGEYFEPGHNFKVVVENCEWLTARDKREYVIINTQILESDCEKQGEGRKPAYMINMSIDPGEGNLNGFLRIALTQLAKADEEVLDPKDDDYWGEQLDCSEIGKDDDGQPIYGGGRAILDAVLGENNVLAGVELYLYTKPILTKEKKPFTIHEWSLEPTAQALAS
jgi:hypothetical protein